MESAKTAESDAEAKLAELVIADLVSAGVIREEKAQPTLSRILAGRMTAYEWRGLIELARPTKAGGGK